ncbi:S-adenosyl-L-methionine-dependent methyltransferase [Aspergillus karnatakaensis]|uniref:S-adenosyl-L-methionine-dependent methyltransferase n=1 Tax=Aspergillus karnatakaensis TaxID=1810916 RepID=UPI003CCE1759
MPRITTKLILQAYQRNPLLPLLLKECRTLDSAKNELRWLRDRALLICGPRPILRKHRTSRHALGWRRLLRSMCLSRAKGVPLQYILGDQPFGDLDIQCTKGVLIPRHETEAITIRAADLILAGLRHAHGNDQSPLRIIDLCTGTGCIPLLLHALLSPHCPKLSITGIDINTAAIKLARNNIRRNVSLGLLSERALDEVEFQKSNVLEYGHGGFPGKLDLYGTPALAPRYDILISNPPYVSPREYYGGTTSRSTRIFEPKAALVPPESALTSMICSVYLRQEDVFYHHMAFLVSSFQVRLAVFECGNRPQALRVAAFCRHVLTKGSTLGQVKVDVWSVNGFDMGPSAVFVHINMSSGV